MAFPDFLSFLLAVACDPWVIASLLSAAGYSTWLYARADEAFTRAMKDEDTRDGLLAKKHLRALRRGMLIMEVARNPRLIKEEAEKILRQRQILRKTHKGEGLKQLHSEGRGGRSNSRSPPASRSGSLSPNSRAAPGIFPSSPVNALRKTDAWTAGGHDALSDELHDLRWVHELSQVELLSHLDPGLLHELGQRSKVVSFRSGERWKPSSAFSVVLEGEVMLWLAVGEAPSSGDERTPKRGESSHQLLRRFGPGTHCSGFLPILSALAAPNGCLGPTMPPADTSARCMELSAASDGRRLELTADTLRWLSTSNRTVANALVEMVLIRFARVARPLLAYLSLPLTLSPVLRLPQPPQPLVPPPASPRFPGGAKDNAEADSRLEGARVAARRWLEGALGIPKNMLSDRVAPLEVHRLPHDGHLELNTMPPCLLLPINARLYLTAAPNTADGPNPGGTSAGSQWGERHSGPLAEDGGGRQELVLEPGAVFGLLDVLTAIPSAMHVRATSSRTTGAPPHGADLRSPRGGGADGILVATLPAVAFRQLCRRHPPFLLRCASLLQPQLPTILRVLDPCAQFRHLRAGEEVCPPAGGSASGVATAPDPAVVLVLCGRVRAAEDERRGERVVGMGASLGEADVMLGQAPQRLTAVRDAQVVVLAGSVINAVAALHPRIPLSLGQRLARQVAEVPTAPPLRTSASRATLGPRPTAPTGASRGCRAITLLPHDSTAELAEAIDYLCETLHAALGDLKQASRILDSRSLTEALGHQVFAPFGEVSAVSWLGGLEERHHLLIYRADPFPSEWTLRCLRQTDLVLVCALGGASASPSSPQLEAMLRHVDHEHVAPARELLLLHSPAHAFAHGAAHGLASGSHGSARTSIQGTRAWLEQLQVRAHHHVRIHSGSDGATFDAHHYCSDFSRLARALSGFSFGVVLGGGGARGLAHLGVLRAMREEGIPIDMIGGTSQGAYIGGVWALNDDPFDPIGSVTTVRLVVRQFCALMSSVWEKIKELTLPITSYFHGGGFNRILVSTFGDAKIEDCPTPFYCVTTDLSTSHGLVHRNGSLWRYIRASMTLTGYLPPVCDSRSDETGNEQTHLLVDGGYVNNLPADVMKRACGADTVIAVDVSSDVPFRSIHYGHSLNGFWLLLRRLSPFQKGGSVPSMGEISSQLAYVSSEWQRDETLQNDIDLYLKPPVEHVGTLEFQKLQEVQAIGYEEALVKLRRWKAELRARGDPRCAVFDLAGTSRVQWRKDGSGPRRTSGDMDGVAQPKLGTSLIPHGKSSDDLDSFDSVRGLISSARRRLHLKERMEGLRIFGRSKLTAPFEY